MRRQAKSALTLLSITLFEIGAAAVGAPPFGGAGSGTDGWHGLLGLGATAIAADPPRAQGGDVGQKTLQFVDFLSRGAYEEAHAMFNTSMQNFFFTRKLAKIWDGVQGEYGAYQDAGLPAESVIKGYRVIDVPARFQWNTLILRVAWDSLGAISRFDFIPITPKATEGPANEPAHSEEITLEPSAAANGPTATLSVPEIHGVRVPVVMLISDRDRKTLVDQTDAFLSHRIAVLRWQRKFEASRWAISTDPAVTFLINRPEIDRRRIFLLGESSDSLGAYKSEHKIAGVDVVPDIRMDSDAIARMSDWINGGEPVK